MGFKALLAAALAVACAATPAVAAPIVLSGNPSLSYGSLTGTTLGSTFSNYTAYTNSPQCLGISTLCYKGNDTYAIIAQANATELLIHPGPGAGGNSAIGFTATTLGKFAINALATSTDVGSKNVGYFVLRQGILTDIFTSGTISGGSAQTVAQTVVLNSGDTLGFFVENNGQYFNDSTNLSGSISAVPETATWAMMIAGFGMVGFVLRRRRREAVTSAYA